MIVPALVGAVALLGVAGRWYRRSLSAALSARYERRSDGIIRGAEPIERTGTNRSAILMVHGGGDTPQTMRHLAQAFHERGYTVVAPLLPGHGRDLASFDAHDADTWFAEVLNRFETLRKTHEWVGVIGLSMGGALSARLAAETQQVDALILASPYLSMPAVGDIVARTSPVWGTLIPAIRTASNLSVLDPEARSTSLGYGVMTHRSLWALRLTATRGFAALGSITSPTLVIQSTTDNRISTAATQRAFDRLGASDKKLEWIQGAGHVITVDYGWERVVTRSLEWMETHRAEKKTERQVGAPLSSRG